MSALEVAGLALPVLVGFGLMGIAALVARTGWSHLHNRVYAGLYLLSGMKSLSEGLLGGTPAWADRFHAESPLFPGSGLWLMVQAVCAFFMAPLLLHFVLAFPQPSRVLVRFRALGPLLYLPSAVLAAAFLLWTPGLAADGTFRYPAWIDVLYGFEATATCITFVALYRLVRTWRRGAEAIERKQAAYLLAGFVPAFVVTWMLTLDHLATYAAGRVVLPGLRALVGTELVHLVSPVLELAAAGMVGYAILKYRLLRIELQVKGGFRYAIMTVFLGTSLFLVNTVVGDLVLQNYVFSFAGPAGSAFLGGAFTILVFHPIEKLSGKLTDKLFPETTEEAYGRRRAREIYRAQATYVLRDAQVTDRELQFLRELRSQLGLSEAEAQSIEESVERRLGVDSERTGQGEAPSRPDAAEAAGPGPAAPDPPSSPPSPASPRADAPPGPQEGDAPSSPTR